MTEYHSEHFSRKLSDAFVTTFAADVQIFSVTIIMLIAKAIIYLSYQRKLALVIKTTHFSFMELGHSPVNVNLEFPHKL